MEVIGLANISFCINTPFVHVDVSGEFSNKLGIDCMSYVILSVWFPIWLLLCSSLLTLKSHDGQAKEFSEGCFLVDFVASTLQ